MGIQLETSFVMENGRIYIYIYIYGRLLHKIDKSGGRLYANWRKYITNIKNDHNLRHAFPDTSSTGGSVRANIFRYPLQKMEVVFLSREITIVLHLVDANPHVYTP